MAEPLEWALLIGSFEGFGGWVMVLTRLPVVLGVAKVGAVIMSGMTIGGKECAPQDPLMSGPSQAGP